MNHVQIQIDPSQKELAQYALESHCLRHSRVNGDCLVIPAHDDGKQVEDILRHAGVRLFSAPLVLDGSGY